LLLGLVREGEGIAAGVLESLGVKLDKVRDEVMRVTAEGNNPADEPELATPSSSAPPRRRRSGDDQAWSVSRSPSRPTIGKDEPGANQ